MRSLFGSAIDRPTAWVLLVAALLAAGCGDSDETGTTAASGSGSGSGGAAGGPPVEGCPPGEVTEADGACRPAGVPIDGCAEGFEADDRGGCLAVLPAEPCPEGKMAVPGETACREIAPCGDATFGDIEDAPGTHYVDAAYDGSDSDGTKPKPWTTIQEGVDAVGSGGVVAVAAGTYEPFTVNGAISVVGRCPSMVEVVGPADAPAVTVMGDGAVLRGLAIRGSGFGLATFAEDVTVDRCWVHATALVGVYAGDGSVHLVDSLVEDTGEVGCGAEVGSLSLERSVVRRVRPNAGGTLGAGVVVQPGAQGAVGTLAMQSSVIEDNTDHGVLIAEADAVIDATVIRGTQPRPSDETFGRGLAIIGESAEVVPVLTLTRSVLDANHDTTLFVGASRAVIQKTAIRNSKPIPGGIRGRGIEAQWHPSTGARASLELADSIIEECYSTGVLLLDSDAAVAGTVIRAIHPEPSGDPSGRAVEVFTEEQPPQITLRETLIEHCAQALLSSGATVDIERTAFRDNGLELAGDRATGLIFQPDEVTKIPSRGWIKDSLLERHRHASLLVIGSEMNVERTRILDTSPSAGGLWGRGLVVQDSIETGLRGRLAMVEGSVERSVEAGVVVIDSDADFQNVTIADTVPSVAGDLGDGLAVVTLDHQATVRVSAARIQGSARAGIGNFGSAVTVSDTVLECNAIDLDGEEYSGVPFGFSDEGGNTCGCQAKQNECTVVTSQLEPPAGVAP